jgi:PIN domain nuclease of toxin-antitoxin system
VNLLLDTHIFLWFITEDSKLTKEIKESIASLQNEVYLSSVSIWECLTKYRIGKLSLGISHLRKTPPVLPLPRGGA